MVCLQDVRGLVGVGGSNVVGTRDSNSESPMKNNVVRFQFSKLWNNEDELMLCKLSNIFPGAQKSASTYVRR